MNETKSKVKTTEIKVYGNAVAIALRSAYKNKDVANVLRILPTVPGEILFGVCEGYINIEGDQLSGFRFKAPHSDGIAILKRFPEWA